MQQGKWEESEELSKKIMADSPNYQPTYDFLFMNYLRRPPARRRGCSAQKVEVFKDKVEAPIQLAAFYQATQRPGDAEAVLNNILNNPKQYPLGRLRVGDFYMRLQNSAKALQVFEEGITKDPERKTQYRLKVATVKASGRQVDEALKVVETALQEDPKNNDVLSMRAALLLVSQDKEKTQRAIADLQQLLGRTPENLVVRYNLRALSEPRRV